MTISNDILRRRGSNTERRVRSRECENYSCHRSALPRTIPFQWWLIGANTGARCAAPAIRRRVLRLLEEAYVGVSTV